MGDAGDMGWKKRPLMELVRRGKLFVGWLPAAASLIVEYAIKKRLNRSSTRRADAFVEGSAGTKKSPSCGAVGQLVWVRTGIGVFPPAPFCGLPGRARQVLAGIGACCASTHVALPVRWVRNQSALRGRAAASHARGQAAGGRTCGGGDECARVETNSSSQSHRSRTAVAWSKPDIRLQASGCCARTTYVRSEREHMLPPNCRYRRVLHCEMTRTKFLSMRASPSNSSAAQPPPR